MRSWWVDSWCACGANSVQAMADKESVTQKRMIQMLADRVEECNREARSWKIQVEAERARVAEVGPGNVVMFGLMGDAD